MNIRLWHAYARGSDLKERVLRRLMPTRMRFVHYSYPLRSNICPCDVHFCDYMQERDLRAKAIFHMGTGGHHIVGLQNHHRGLRNEILGITVSPREHRRYVSLVIRDPVLGQNYRVLFADVYGLSSASLPSFDVVTLFHLGEFGSTTRSGRALSDADVLQLLCSKLVPEGLLVLYPGSYGWQRLGPLIAQATAAGQLALVESYKTLLIFRVAATDMQPAAIARE